MTSYEIKHDSLGTVVISYLRHEKGKPSPRSWTYKHYPTDTFGKVFLENNKWYYRVGNGEKIPALTGKFAQQSLLADFCKTNSEWVVLQRNKDDIDFLDGMQVSSKVKLLGTL